MFSFQQQSHKSYKEQENMVKSKGKNQQKLPENVFMADLEKYF
jgi:hypothetical protein